VKALAVVNWFDELGLALTTKGSIRSVLSTPNAC
jgi:hypothetical protein